MQITGLVTLLTSVDMVVLVVLTRKGRLLQLKKPSRAALLAELISNSQGCIKQHFEDVRENRPTDNEHQGRQPETVSSQYDCQECWESNEHLCALSCAHIFCFRYASDLFIYIIAQTKLSFQVVSKTMPKIKRTAPFA